MPNGVGDSDVDTTVSLTRSGGHTGVGDRALAALVRVGGNVAGGGPSSGGVGVGAAVGVVVADSVGGGSGVPAAAVVVAFIIRSCTSLTYVLRLYRF